MKKSNEPTKTNEAMKKTMKKFLSMAAFALVGAVMTGCSSDDLANNQQPANKNNVVTLTTTVNLGGDGTRALGADGKKTFATGDKIAVIYKDTDGNTLKAESEALTEGGGSSATFTVTLTDPKAEGAVRYIYPAAMAAATVATSTAVTDDATINYAALASQDGTLTTLASKYDLAVFDGSLTADATLPVSSTLTNRLAVIAYTIKDNTDTPPIDLTGTITEMTLSDGTNSYTVTRSAATGPIYVAIQPTSGANIDYTATAGTSVYTKTSTNKTYAASNFYQQGLLVSNPELLGDCFTVNGSGGKVAFSQGNLQATYNGSTWTWAFAEHQWDCIGSASGNTKVSTTSPYVYMGGAGSVTVDLFGWVGASSIWTDVNKFGITKSATYNNVDGYGNVANENMKAEWNSENLTITNAGSYTWRTLTGGGGGEWEWILGPSSSPVPGTNCRASGSTVNGTPNARWTNATINTDGTGVNGVILFPDGCRINAGSATTWGAINGNSTWGTKCTTAQWQHLEKLGCVFLPAAGNRMDGVDGVGSWVYYWSKTHGTTAGNASYLIVYDGQLYPAGTCQRQIGCSVRLVRDIAAPAPAVPTGALNGVFSVSSTKQVKFSKGNLKYNGSTWSFFDNQYDYFTTHDGTNWDKFCWSTSATTYGMNTSVQESDYSGDFVDWGSNSDLQTALGTGWFTLSSDEWKYLFYTRSASTVGGTSNGRYAKAKVNGVQGMILFPDTYTHPDGVTAPIGVNASGSTGWNGNNYSSADWTKMESAGCVFLPAAGDRYGSSAYNLGTTGYYWSATPLLANYALRVRFYSGDLYSAEDHTRNEGYSVRLVREVE